MVITALTLILTVLFCNGQALGIETAARAAGYETRLFDRAKVHSIDIVIDGWDSFLETCESETYALCDLVIDGESVRKAGIRGKGNTSLSSVRNMGSSRYSFKIEFDQYVKGKSYHGLDKLCLNNIIQDNTYMKDYLAYTMMYDFGADAPLCSYAYVTVNGEDWGLYLAVEAVEESFLERNYGTNYGELYKPDSLSFGGGGPGNGKDFRMSDFMNRSDGDSEGSDSDAASGRSGRRGGNMPDFGRMPGGFDPSQFGGGDFDPSQFGGDFDPSQFGGGNFDPSQFGGNFDPSQFGGDFDPSQFGGDFDPSQFGSKMPDFGGMGGGFGMGSDDVKLKYTDDEISSYSNIFNNAKTAADTADQKRLIRSLKALSEQDGLEQVLDTDEVLRYFVVHNFLCNGDSYTGQMIHNYYLYEENGQLSMIPWDYNLAYGTFMGGNGSSSVNSPIDTPVSGDMSDRPMVSWIFDSEAYTGQYHQLFREFLDSTDFEKTITDTAALIDEYVQKDPTKFCTYEEYQKGVTAILQFCQLRAESVAGQLDGTIPATSAGQKADSSALIGTDGLNLSDMGSMGSGGGFGGRKSSGKQEGSDKPAQPEQSKETFRTAQADTVSVSALSFGSGNTLKLQSLAAAPDFGGQPPAGFDPNNMPEGFDPNNMPEGFDPGNMPEGFDPGNMPGGFDKGQKPKGSSDDKVQKGTEPAKTEAGSGTVTTGSGQKSGSTETAASAKSSRSQRGDFPSPGSSGNAGNLTVYILLGASALVLILGIAFAARFKR